MPPARFPIRWILAAVLLFSLLVSRPQLFGQTVASPQRDATALSALSQMLTATGWSATLPQDIVAVGNITRYYNNTQDVVGIKLESTGARLYRSEVSDPSGTIVTILNGDQAAASTPGSTSFLSGPPAIAMRPVAFPFFAGVLAFADSTCSVQYDDTETLGSQAAYRLEISPQPLGTDPISVLRAQANHLMLWVSVSSGLPLQLSYMRISNTNPTASRQVTRTFSDYRQINGLNVPFHQEEFAGGQMLLSLQFDTVSFNTGIPSSDFALPISQN
jgi:hypothetical protein